MREVHQNIQSIEIYRGVVEFESFISQLQCQQIALHLAGNKYAELNGMKEFIEEWARQSDENQSIFNFATTSCYIPRFTADAHEALVAVTELAAHIRNLYPNSYKAELKPIGSGLKRTYSDSADSSSHLPHRNSSSALLF